MHHDIIGRRHGYDTSHINANKLDNQRANLRHTTRSENMLNPADGPNKARISCPYRGVTRDDRSRRLANPWRGKVVVHGKIHQTTRYHTAEEARDALIELRLMLGIQHYDRPKEVFGE